MTIAVPLIFLKYLHHWFTTVYLVNNFINKKKLCVENCGKVPQNCENHPNRWRNTSTRRAAVTRVSAAVSISVVSNFTSARE